MLTFPLPKLCWLSLLNWSATLPEIFKYSIADLMLLLYIFPFDSFILTKFYWEGWRGFATPWIIRLPDLLRFTCYILIIWWGEWFSMERCSVFPFLLEKGITAGEIKLVVIGVGENLVRLEGAVLVISIDWKVIGWLSLWGGEGRWWEEFLMSWGLIADCWTIILWLKCGLCIRNRKKLELGAFSF